MREDPKKVRRDCVRMIRQAWPHRRSLRGRLVIKANVATLRKLAS